MSRRWIQILLAIVIGVFVTIVTAAVASALSSESAREVLFWPNTVLQSFVPASNIGPPHRPLYEGTPLNFVAFVASFPFSVVVYGAVAYVFLRHLKT
jgi:hypothetical protein